MRAAPSTDPDVLNYSIRLLPWVQTTHQLDRRGVDALSEFGVSHRRARELRICSGTVPGIRPQLTDSPWPDPFPPPTPPLVAQLCSPASPVLWACPTSPVRPSVAFALRLPTTPQGAIPLGKLEISRFSCKMCPCMLGVSDYVGSPQAPRHWPAGCCLPPSPRTSAPQSAVFEAQYPAYTFPCQRFARSLTRAGA